MYQEMKNVLVASHGKAPCMTHAFGRYGNGHMGCGVRKFWGDTLSIGICIGGSLCAGGQLIYRAITYKQRNLNMAEAIGSAYNAGVEVGKQQEQALCTHSIKAEERTTTAEE